MTRIKDIFDNLNMHISTREKGRNQKPLDLQNIEDIDLEPARDAVKKAMEPFIDVFYGSAVERQVIASFDYVSIQRSYIEELLKESFLLFATVRDQHILLDEAITEFPLSREKATLVAFSTILDKGLTLNQTVLDRLVETVQEWAKADTKDKQLTVLRQARSRAIAKSDELEKEIQDPIDVLALFMLLSRKDGLKPAITSPELEVWIDRFFTENSCLLFLGGAAGNETEILRAMDVEVWLHTPYHHEESVSHIPAGTKRLRFRPGQYELSDADMVSSCDMAGPRRSSGILQVTRAVDGAKNVSPRLILDGDIIAPRRSDRSILRFPHPFTVEPRPWRFLRVAWKAPASMPLSQQDVEWDSSTAEWYVELDMESKEFRNTSWPWLPVFQHPLNEIPEKPDTMLCQLVSAEEMSPIAEKLDVVLLGGIQGLGKESFYGSEPLVVLLRAALSTQLKVLSQNRVRLHCELSGVGSGKELKQLDDLFKESHLTHISLNREELIQITGLRASPCFTSPPPPVPDSPLGIYCRAVALLNNLEIETVYVHDIELDILVCRKKKVESPEDIESRLKKHRHAMLLAKAAVPASLIARAKVSQDWDLVLSTESLAAHIGFAVAYSKFMASKEGDQKGIRKSLLEKSYYYLEEEEIGVVVGPAVYVDLSRYPGVNLSGAGDRCFAVHAVACGE